MNICKWDIRSNEKTYQSIAVTFEAHTNCEIEEDLGQLAMSQGEGPESEVTGGVRDGSQGVLDGLDHLVDHHLSKAMVMDVLVWIVAQELLYFLDLGVLLELEVVIDFLLCLLAFDDWFSKEHDRNTEYSNDEEGSHHFCLARNERCILRSLWRSSEVDEHDDHG